VQDIRRIAFVSQRYLELQGLGLALCGAGMILGCLMMHLAGTGPSGAAFMPFMLGSVLAANVTPYLLRSYQRSFGHAVGTRVQQFTAGLPQLLVVAGGLADMSFQMQGWFAPSVAAIALAASSAVIVLRDWRYRLHHLVGIAAGITGAIVTSLIPHSVNQWGDIGPGRVEAYLLAYTIVGLGLMAIGLLDHQLLMSFMRPEQPVDAIPVDELAGRLVPRRAALAGLLCVLIGGLAWSADEVMLARLLPTVLIGAVLMFQVMFGIQDVRRIARAISRSQRALAPPAVDLKLRGDVLFEFFVLAAAAAIDSALFPHRAPDALTGALVVTGGWLVARDWKRRAHYAIVVLAALLAAVSTRHLAPAHSLAFFIAAVSGGLAIAWVVDAWGRAVEGGPGDRAQGRA
jgi:hypothetical protein